MDDAQTVVQASDSSFFRKIAIGAAGARSVAKRTSSRHGHKMAELERGSTDTKLWKDVKRKRVRIPDLVCLRCGSAGAAATVNAERCSCPTAIRGCRSARCPGGSITGLRPRGLTRSSARTPCGTPSPPTSTNAPATSWWSSGRWVTGTCRPPRSIPTWSTTPSRTPSNGCRLIDPESSGPSRPLFLSRPQNRQSETVGRQSLPEHN